MTGERIKALERRIEALEVKLEAVGGFARGWREGFSATVNRSLRRMDERIDRMLESDDSNVFELNQWIEEIKALRKNAKALEKRVKSLSDFAIETRDMVPERPKGVLSRCLEDSIRKVTQ